MTTATTAATVTIRTRRRRAAEYIEHVFDEPMRLVLDCTQRACVRLRCPSGFFIVAVYGFHRRLTTTSFRSDVVTIRLFVLLLLQ